MRKPPQDHDLLSSSPADTTFHATAIEIENHGILITGQSSSGKSSLAFGLLEKAHHWNLNAAIISDDRTILIPSDDGILAKAPANLGGLAELHGFGIVSLKHTPKAPIHLIVDLNQDATQQRMPEPSHTEKLFSHQIKSPIRKLELSPRHETQNVRIIFATLGSMGIKNPIFNSNS